jgi:hypothetical protein
MGVNVQPRHPGSNPHGCEFGFLLFILKKLAVVVSPTAFLSKKSEFICFLCFARPRPSSHPHVLASTVRHLGEASATDAAANFSHREEERLGEEGKTQEAAKAVVY